MFKPFLTKWPFLFKLRLFLAIVLLIIILVFLYLKIVPFGHIVYTRTWPRGLASGKGFIYDFKPVERIATAKNQSLKIIGEPVYFSLFTPRTFDRAIMTIKYRDRLSATTPIIEAGVLKDKISDAYDLRPMQNKILDELSFTWSRLEDTEGKLILQATKNYSDSAEFEKDLAAGRLKDCPPGDVRSCVALYNYSFPFDYRWPDYQAIFPLVINQPLRGAHQFYVYFNGSWRLGFNFVDLNQDKAADPITINVRSVDDKGTTQSSTNDRVIASQSLTDENAALASGQTENKEIVLRGDAAPSGVYKIEVKVSDDIVIAKINSSSDKLSFINKVWPVSGGGNLTLLTDAADLQAQTFSPGSLQTINFGGRDFVLDKTYEPFDFSPDAETDIGTGNGMKTEIKEIKLEKDDVILAGNGVFSFSRASLFNPDFKKINRFFAPGDEVKYIVADYARPFVDDGLKTARVEFDLNGAYREDGKYTFLISVPGLKTSDGRDDYLEIEEIEVELEGKTLWGKVREIRAK